MVHYLIGLLSTILVFMPVLLDAQGPGRARSLKSAGCLKLAEQGLSENQQEALQMIENRYSDRVIQQRNEMMIKRIELQSLIRDPDAPEDAIRLKADSLGAVQEELRKTMIDYQIDIRRILTSEQMRSWCTLLGEPGHWMGR